VFSTRIVDVRQIELSHVPPIPLVSRLRELLGAAIRIQPIVESVAEGEDVPASSV
jgi:hypothetical protein